MSEGVALPPGQHRVAGFPRFGTHLHRPAPAVPADPAIELVVPGLATSQLPVAELASLPRRRVGADFHCVSGWSAVGLRWEGVAFETVFERMVDGRPAGEPAITHVTFRGLDGFRSVVELEDALGDDVLVADRLDDRPLGPDHGAPVRLVSPAQYGYISTKHLCRIELHTSRPAPWVGAFLLRRHPRARVRHEERHPELPNWLLRPVYGVARRPIAWLSRRGSSGGVTS